MKARASVFGGMRSRDCLTESCGKLEIQAEDRDESSMLAAINNLLMFGGSITVQRTGKEPREFTMEGIIDSPASEGVR